MKRRWPLILLSLACVLGIGCLGAWALKPQTHLVTVTGLGDQVAFTTTKKDLGLALESQGIHLGPKDLVSPPLNTPLKGKNEMAVVIKKAVPVHVTVDAQTVSVESVATTVGDLLHELSIALAPSDAVSVLLETPLKPDMSIQVVRRTEAVSVTREEIPYQLVRRDDRSMAIGESREIQAGEPGFREIERITRYEDGQEVGSEIVAERIVQDPVDQIVAYGTMGVVSRGGESYRYVRELTMTATGYTAGKESNPNGNGYTYTGMKAERGVVAVDPKVIPLYTRLYIEGYGVAIAADTGGAIKGNRIDLCFDAVREALDWGVRPVRVYVLGD